MNKQQLLERLVEKQGDAHRELHARIREIAALPGYDLDGEPSVKEGLTVYQRLSLAMKRCKAYEEMIPWVEGMYPNEPPPEAVTFSPEPQVYVGADGHVTGHPGEGGKPYTVTGIDP